MNYGNRIAELREKRSWTQEELATTVGITRAALSHYEKNRRKPDFETLTRLADRFDVTIDYLIGRTKQDRTPLDSEVREFVDDLELSDEDLLERYNLTVDGSKLTEEEAKRFIAFVRMERMMK